MTLVPWLEDWKSRHRILSSILKEEEKNVPVDALTRILFDDGSLTSDDVLWSKQQYKVKN